MEGGGFAFNEKVSKTVTKYNQVLNSGFMGLVPFVALSTVSFFIFLAYVKRKKQANMKYCTIEKNLRGKIVLITGATAGLGRELTYELVKRGAEIVMGCRNLAKADEAVSWVNEKLSKLGENSLFYNPHEGTKMHVLPLDLSSMASVESFATRFTERFKNLHILVNNAGIMGGKYEANGAGIEMQYVVNHLGHFHLTNLLLDTLKQSEPSRILVISSGYYRKAKLSDLDLVKSPQDYQPLTAYARSKLANSLHALALSQRLKKTEKIGVYAVRPGFVRGTELGRNFSSLHTALLFPVLWFFSRDVHQGIQTYLHCCLTEMDQLKCGAIYNDCDLDADFNSQLINAESADQLWKKSEELVDECLEAEKIGYAE